MNLNYNRSIVILGMGLMVCILILYVGSPSNDTAEELVASSIELIGQGSYDEAIDKCNEAIDMDQDLTEAYINRAAAYIGKEEFEFAIVDCTRAIELEPSMVLPYTNRGLAYIGTEQYDKAIADYIEAIELDPDSTIAYGHLGWVHYLTEQFDLSIETNIIGLEIDPKQSWIQYNLALAYFAEGSHELAKAEYEKSVRSNTSAIAVEKAIDELNEFITANPEREDEIADIMQILEEAKTKLPY